MEKSTQISTIVKYQKKILNVLVILIHSVFRTGNNHYPQVLSEEYQYVVKEKRFWRILLMT